MSADSVTGRVLVLAGPLVAVWAAWACHAASAPPPWDVVATGEPSAAAELALADHGCVACHAAGFAARRRLRPPEAPRLDEVGARVTPGYLERFLTDPAGTKPGTRMPDLLAGSSRRKRARTVERLVHFLAARGGPVDPEPVGIFAATLEHGRQLFHSVGCVACHAPLESRWDLEVPWWELEEELEGEAWPDEDEEEDVTVRAPSPEVALGDLAAKTSAHALAAFLREPLAVRPSGRMPALGLADSEARAIAAYLLREQVGDDARARFPGLAYEYYEEEDFPEDMPDFEALVPVRTGTVPDLDELPAHREDWFALRFSGFLRVDVAGEYELLTASDDGSQLFLDGELVVDNGGLHGMNEEGEVVFLEPGQHALVVTMYEAGGDEELEVYWSGPGLAEQPIAADRLTHRALALRPPADDFEVDPSLAAEGRALFGELGCGACHATGDAELDAAPPPDAPAFASLRVAPTAGCLAERPARGLPRFALDDATRAAIAEAVSRPAALAGELPEPARLARELTRLRCDACHSRAGVGGPDRARSAYFLVEGGHDLGDEGRLPPHLDEPGAKLRPEWLRRVLFEGASARPYMATRMPRFGEANVAHLAGLFEHLDSVPGGLEEPVVDLGAVEDGRHLVGTSALGCINCHDFDGHPSLGIPATDLAEIHERIQPGWFRRLLLDPIALNMNTRMPEFWVEGRSPVDVLDGDPRRQIDAMWGYLALRSSMPLPEGLVVPDAAYELEPEGRPALCGVFMKGVSPRTLVVGFPELVHYAFDVQRSRLAKVWRGRFFNARGTWEGRAGALEVPPGDDVHDLPRAPVFARLPSADAPWPAQDDEAALPRALGRRLDAAGVPTLRYALGPVTIEETPRPEIDGASGRVRRAFQVTSPEPVTDLWFRGEGGRRRVELERAGDRYVARFEELVAW
jgi:cytochrome c2/cytochrome c551/c552